MKKKGLLVVILLAFVVLIGGAYVLYDKLGDGMPSDNMIVHSAQQTDAEPENAEDTVKAEDNENTESSASDSESAVEETSEQAATEQAAAETGGAETTDTDATEDEKSQTAKGETAENGTEDEAVKDDNYETTGPQTGGNHPGEYADDKPEEQSGEQSEEASGEQSGEEQSEEQSDAPDTISAPDFCVYDKDGNAVNLSDFFGKPIVLNFWASWCGPCKSEMPDFNEKYAEVGDEINFVMVNMTDGQRETVEIASAFIEQNGYSFPVFYDTESEAAITYSAYSLPTSYFIDADGNLVAQAIGAIDAATLQRGIDMITE